MPIRKSIRDIQTNNQISDMVSVEPIKITRNKKISTPKEIMPEIIKEVFMPIPQVTEIPHTISTPYTQSNIKSRITSVFGKLINLLFKIKTIYLIAFGIILLGLTILMFIPSGKQKDPAEQVKKESTIVKKQFSKHIILPESEQIDIRKITNKMQDPFFKDAEVGDYLIIFYKSRIAYIYSIDRDIIINAGVVFIDPKTATTSPVVKTQ